MEKEFIYKSRSFSSCIQAAYKLLCENTRNILRCTWLPVLLLGILSGIFVTINMRDPRIEALVEAHTGWFLAFFAISIPAILVCAFWALARLMSMLNGQRRRWNVMRLLGIFAFEVIIVAVASALIWGGVWLLARHLGADIPTTLTDNWVVVLAALLVVFLLSLPLNYVFMRYLIDEDANLLSFKAYRTGLRYLGFIFITYFITGIITGIITLIISIPLIILVTAHTYSIVGYLNGDPLGMPAHFIALHAATYAVTLILLWYVSMFVLLVTLFMYGSIEKQREERRNTRLTDNDTDTDNSENASL